MSRNPEKLEVFRIADNLVLDVYRSTQNFPIEERYGLQSQIRRATVSIAANIVEACSRDYLHFMTIALGSASEARYLLKLACRLEFVTEADHTPIHNRLDQLVRSLQKLINTLKKPD